MKSHLLKTSTRVFAMIAMLGIQTAFTPEDAWAKPRKETKAEKAQRLQQEEMDARLDKIDINTLDPVSAAALLRDRQRRQAEKDRELFRKYDGVNPKFNRDTFYTRDSELHTPPTRPPSFGPWVEVDGQRVRGVYRRSVETVHFQGTVTTSFEGLENDKGQVLLPCVYREIHVVPGRGVILSSYIDGGYESYNVRTGERKPLSDLRNVLSKGNFKSFVLVTGLNETVDIKPSSPQGEGPVAAVKTVATSQPSATPTAPERRKLPLAKIEFLNERGENYFTLEKAAAITANGSNGQFFLNVSGFNVTFPLTPTGEIAMLLLDAEWKPTGDYMPRAFMSGESSSMGLGLMIPSPFLENAWLKMAPDGKSFGSPVGTLGYRPLGTQSMAATRIFEIASKGQSNRAPDELFWVLAYSTPEGIGWRWLDPHTLEPTGPMWKDVRQVESPLLEENHSFTGPLIAVQEIDGRWKALQLPRKQQVLSLSESRPGRLGMVKFSPIVVSKGPMGQEEALGHATLADLVDYAEQQGLQAKAQKIASDKWHKHYEEVELPRLRRESRWDEALRSNDWSKIEATAVSLGDKYFIEYVERYPNAKGDHLRRAAKMVSEPAKKEAFERRAKLADEKAVIEAARRESAIADFKRRMAPSTSFSSNSSSSSGFNPPQWDGWKSHKTYAEQSAQHATKMKAMLDYTYGRLNNPLLNPFK